MISIHSVSKSYNKKDMALNDVSLEVKSGEIFGFIGQNGAGKTTLIRIITGILKADKGDIYLNNIDLAKNTDEAKRQFALIPDTPEIYNKIRGIDWLHFMGAIYKVPTTQLKNKISELADKFELTDALYNKVGTYSFGMKHKLSLLGGLIYNPSILIFDEPLQGLDPKATFLLKEVMRQHAEQGGTIFFSTHLLDVAEKLCDRFAVIKQGCILTVDNMSDVQKKNISLESYFMELIK